MTDTDDTDDTAVELRSLIGRIEQLLEVPAPLAALDAYGNPGTVAAGELIESAWGNSVSGRVVLRYPSFTALNATAPPNGTLALTTDTNVEWIRVGGVWKPTGILPGASAVPWGTATPTGVIPVIKTGAFTGTSSAAGQVTVPYPGGAFATGVIYVGITPVSAFNYAAPAGRGAITTTSVLAYLFTGTGGVVASTTVDLMIMAIGW